MALSLASDHTSRSLSVRAFSSGASTSVLLDRPTEETNPLLRFFLDDGDDMRSGSAQYGGAEGRFPKRQSRTAVAARLQPMSAGERAAEGPRLGTLPTITSERRPSRPLSGRVGRRAPGRCSDRRLCSHAAPSCATGGGTSRSGDDTVMENALEYLARDMGFEGRRDMTARCALPNSPHSPPH